jgi:hypothetical protein
VVPRNRGHAVRRLLRRISRNVGGNVMRPATRSTLCAHKPRKVERTAAPKRNQRAFDLLPDIAGERSNTWLPPARIADAFDLMRA